MPNIDVYLEFLIEQKASDMHMSSDTPVAFDDRVPNCNLLRMIFVGIFPVFGEYSKYFIIVDAIWRILCDLFCSTLKIWQNYETVDFDAGSHISGVCRVSPGQRNPTGADQALEERYGGFSAEADEEHGCL